MKLYRKYNDQEFQNLTSFQLVLANQQEIGVVGDFVLPSISNRFHSFVYKTTNWLDLEVERVLKLEKNRFKRPYQTNECGKELLTIEIALFLEYNGWLLGLVSNQEGEQSLLKISLEILLRKV